jgi:hypothetical protein
MKATADSDSDSDSDSDGDRDLTRILPPLSPVSHVTGGSMSGFRSGLHPSDARRMTVTSRPEFEANDCRVRKRPTWAPSDSQGEGRQSLDQVD